MDDVNVWLFAGLTAGAAVDEASGERFYVYAGVDRLREMLAIPTPHPQDYEPKYRPDDVPVRKPVKPDPTPVGAGPAGAGGLPAGAGPGLLQLLEALQKAQAQRGANPGAANPAPAAPAPATPPAGVPGGQATGQPTTPPQQPR